MQDGSRPFHWADLPPRWARWTLAAVVIAGIVVFIANGRPGKPANSPLIVGHDPGGIALDAPSHHVFVVNNGDSTISMINTRHTSMPQTLAVPGIRYPQGGGFVIARNAAHVFAAFEKVMSMLDVKSGRVLRVMSLNAPPFDLKVDEHTGRVFVAESANFALNGNTIGIFDAYTGLLVHRVSAGKVPGAFAVDERSGKVFVENLGENTISVLDARSGALVRTITINRSPSILAQLAQFTQKGMSAAIPAVAVVDPVRGRLFVGRYNAVSVLDERTGRIVRSTTVGRVPVLIALDEQTGRVFVGNYQEGTISVLDASTGRRLRTVHIGGGPSALAVAASAGLVYAAGDSTVSVLDARSGRVLRTLPAGIGPVSMAVDETAHRLYVVDMLAHPGSGHAAAIVAREPAWLRLLQRLPFMPHPDESGTGSIPGSVIILPAAR